MTPKERLSNHLFTQKKKHVFQTPTCDLWVCWPHQLPPFVGLNPAEPSLFLTEPNGMGGEMMEDTMETCNSEGDTWSDHFVATKNRRNESNLGVWAFEGLWIFKLRPTTKDPPWQSSCYLAGITGCFGFGMLETTWRHSLTLKIVSFNTFVIISPTRPVASSSFSRLGNKFADDQQCKWI